MAYLLRGEMAEADGEHSQRRAAQIKAIDHPLRRCILRAFLTEGGALSPVQISRGLTARGLKAQLGSVAYQVRVLHRLFAVKSTGKRQVRGAIQRFYEATIENDPPIETLLEETREGDEAEMEDREDG
jgi:hypothetical protein